MSRYRELTPKQAHFVQEYIGNGYNATRAVLAVYKQSYGAARVTGSRLLTNANIHTAIEAELQGYGIDRAYAARKHAELLDSEDEYVVLGAIKEYHRITGAYPARQSRTVQATVTLEDIIDQQKRSRANSKIF